MPTSLFDDYGDMRKGTKVVLVNKLAAMTEDLLPPFDAVLI